MSLTLKTKSVNSKAGFTLLEILLVVGIISILAGIVILAINPTKQLGDTRNAQRRSDVLTILNAVYQYALDNNGNLPSEITTGTCALDSTHEIGNDNTGSFVNLYDNLVGGEASSTYLVAIPHDPQATSTDSGDGSGYGITKTSGNRVTVCAPLSVGEGNIVDSADMISVTR